MGVGSRESKGDAAALTGVTSGELNGKAVGMLDPVETEAGRASVGLSPSLFANQVIAAVA